MMKRYAVYALMKRFAVSALMRRFAIYAMMAYIAHRIARPMPPKVFWIFFFFCVARDLAKTYLLKLPWFAYDPNKLNYLERHTVNLWEHV